MERNRGVSDPGEARSRCPVARSGVAHASVPGDRWYWKARAASPRRVRPQPCAEPCPLFGFAPGGLDASKSVQLPSILRTRVTAMHIACVDALGHHTRADVTELRAAW